MGRKQPSKIKRQNENKGRLNNISSGDRIINVPSRTLLFSNGENTYEGGISVFPKLTSHQLAGWRNVFYHGSVLRTWIVPTKVKGKNYEFGSPCLLKNGILLPKEELPLPEDALRNLSFLVETIKKECSFEGLELRTVNSNFKGQIKNRFPNSMYEKLGDSGIQVYDARFPLTLPTYL